MCGIAGVADYRGQRRLSAVVGAMTASLVHRGPDAAETWFEPGSAVGLGHTRLAIIDAEGGRQPMLSSDGKAAIVFNGEIYNHRALRAELEALGRSFTTHSDTEVALQAYRQWGEEALARFRGMFALAVFELDRRSLFLARDRTGIKPLYYAATPGGFAFASELKALLEFEGVSRAADWTSLTDLFVLGYPVLPKTFFKACRELEPGCWLRLDRGGRLRTGRFWRWTRRETPMSWDEAVAGAKGALKSSLEEHLESDVPIGAFLSGGIDSSLIVALLSEISPWKIPTFTASFDEKAYDESEAAAAVARRFGTEHHVIHMDAHEWDLDRVGAIVDQFDQPFGDICSIPTYFLCQEIRKHVKVVLSGDGGDEMFGGYPRFAYADLARALGRVRADVLRPAASVLGRALPSLGRMADRMLAAARPEDRLVSLSCYGRPRDLPGVVSAEQWARVRDYRTGLGGGENPGGAELIDATIDHALPGDYLRKIDITSGAHGLEVRVPYLGSQVLDFAAKLPHEMKCTLGENKRVLRRLAGQLLPAEIVARPKSGFGVPFDSWLGERRRKALGAILLSRSRIRELIRHDFIEEQVRAFVSGRVNLAVQSRENSCQQIYMLWSLERWLRKWNPS